MKICWQKDVELIIVTDFDTKTEMVEQYPERITAGEEDDVDIIEDKGDTVDIQFACGSVAYDVEKKWFIEIGVEYSVSIYNKETGEAIPDRCFELKNKEKAIHYAKKIIEKDDTVFIEVWKKDKDGLYGASGTPEYATKGSSFYVPAKV